jgi:asparagine synthase (glutamine-hydrolysing)
VCGIVGAYREPDWFDVRGGIQALRHRGPDGEGVLEHGAMTHGHVRLAILDLSPASAQPFRYRDGVLSYTGEVWNFAALREELAGRGHAFTTSGDTEVLAAALWEWGAAALPRLEGMFTFAWSRGSTHLLARDRWGKVPLYVVRTAAGGWVWANERKALPHPYAWMAAPLRPGAVLDLDAGTVDVYYRLPEEILPVEDAPALALWRLRAGVHARLVADAPLCCLISGGLDSSLLLSLAREARPDIVAYTAVLDHGSPDLAAAREVCSLYGIELREVEVGPLTAASFDQAVRSIEIPSRVQVEIAALCIPLARRMSADGFKVCLSGEAADEIFGGYGNLIIKGHKASNRQWRDLRAQQLAKMARGNFVRCNKAFMAAGVECRLPYMGRALVELALGLPKVQCPPGKKLLKLAAAGFVPDRIIRRPKETFQGAAGADHAAEDLLGEREAFYAQAMRRHFGGVARE